MNKLLFIVIFFILNSTQLLGATLDGVTLADTVKVDNTLLVLNGIGTRKATWFKVKVYTGGLYLKKKTAKIHNVLTSDYPKFINMHFVRNVSKEKLVGGWNDAYKNALSKKKRQELRSSLDKFNNAMGDIEEGQEIHLTFTKNMVKVKFAKKSPTSIKAPGVAQAILSVWFINATDEGLRDGFLGVK